MPRHPAPRLLAALLALGAAAPAPAAIPLARVGPHGDDLGLLRDGDTFGSTVYLLDHERYWRAGVEGWCEAQAESVTALVVARLQPTAEA